VLEDNSLSTRENALRLRELLAGLPGKKILMTSDYHMYRAFRVFSRAGIVVEPRPIPDIIKRASRYSARWSAFVDLLDENVKIVYYCVRNWM
jgi:uncharacterized SAM-binding protein YcdF (DUF218 family)